MVYTIDMNIILPIHIVIALFSVFYTIYVFFNPSKQKLNISYVLIALTVISGTYLAVILPAHITQTCETGLVYISVILAGVFAVKYKLAKNLVNKGQLN